MEFIENFDGAVMVSDADGNLIYLNDKAVSNFAIDVCRELIGKNLNNCHNDNSNKKIRQMMKTHEKNVYTIEKKGKKKLIYQSPLFHN